MNCVFAFHTRPDRIDARREEKCTYSSSSPATVCAAPGCIVKSKKVFLLARPHGTVNMRYFSHAKTNASHTPDILYVR